MANSVRNFQHACEKLPIALRPAATVNKANLTSSKSAAMAAKVDARIASAWATHPRRFMVESSADFLDKVARALEILRQELPECCRHHVVAALQSRPAK